MAKIREAGTAERRGPGRILLTLITPGEGSSGTYSPETLAQAAKERAFPKGTLGLINHPTATEDAERPEGDLRNLALVTQEDAWVDTRGALVAEAKVASAWRDLVEDFHDAIGSSISASADVSVNESGRPVVERIIPHPFNRVDLVTVAGRGGRIEQLLEAAKVIESRSVVKEAMAEDVRMWLSQTIRNVHADYVWVESHDEQYAYYETGDKFFRQAYTLSGVNVTLTGDPVEVRRRVEYDPVILPSNPAGVTEKKEEANMATTQIEEAELNQLRESASRVTALETELQAEKEARAKEASERAETERLHRVAEAKRIVTEAFGEDAPALYTRLAESVATPEEFDADAFRTEVQEAAAKAEADKGAGTPRGLGGHVTESKTISDEDIANAL